MIQYLQTLAMLALLTLPLFGQEIRGTVTDPSGAAVAGARVVLLQGSAMQETRTGTDGSFQFSNASEGSLQVTAAGFRPAKRVIEGAGPLQVALEVDPGETVITVTSRAETRLNESQQSVVLLEGETVRRFPAFALDEVLRQVPGFSLFRRTGSLTANPTAQGVSLRGIGASGASRALVLQDGVPLNDAFGGWVYWGRLPRLSVQQVEVLEGGASQLYGSTALSGVVQVSSAPRTLTFATAELTSDTYSTPQGAFSGSFYRGGWGVRGSAAGYSTGGYIPTIASVRGRVDTRAASENRLVDLELSRTSAWGEFAVNGNYYRESRDNGTPLQRNATKLGEARLRWQRAVGAGRLALQVFGNGQAYDQSFSAIAADRNSESLTRRQHVPSQRVGGSAVWNSGADRMHRVTAGFDGQAVRGFSQETGFAGGAPTIRVSNGGEQRSFGVFAEDSIRLGARVLITVGIRGDHWTNTDALSIAQPVSTGIITRTALPTTNQTFISPRVSGLLRVSEEVGFTFSVHRAFRAPTLNELYRGFRLGNVQTNANPNLRAEDLLGGEAGILWSHSRWQARVTGFVYEIRDPITNVTLSVTPALILRERRNVGRNQAAGVEWSGSAQLASRLEIRAGYQFAASTVERYPANTALEGLQVAQVPRHGFSFATVWQPGNWSLQLQGRLNSNQFDDDQNLLALGRMALLDASVARTWSGRVRTFVALQNVLNDRYAIALSPVRQVGPGPVVRGGVQVNLRRAERP